ncbi:MAG: folylpolyglutamate synthase/dihydrofolate synthase family protein [archaeon]
MKDSDCINYLFSLQRLGTILGLERISFLLKELGNPQNSFKSIHIAGTNGKGSVSTMLSCILQEYGFKTGLYTSPHMKRFGERIRINSIEIPDKELVFEIKKIKKIVDKKQKKAPYFLPTFFEFAVAIAYDYFARKKVDFAVIETGLGGRLDATNVLSPEVSVITNVSVEHTNYLGDTVEKIAVEKAEIIKPNSTAVTAEKNPSVLKILKAKAEKENTELFEVRKLVKIKNYSFGLEKQKFDLELEGTKINGIELSLSGKFQLINTVTAILALKKLRIKFDKTKIKKALKKAFIAGRFQIVNKKPLIVFDAGHNPACFAEIKETILLMKKKKLFRKLILLIGLSSDKDAEKISEIIFPLADKIVISRAKYRGMSIGKLAGFADKFDKPYIGFHDSQEGFDFALQETDKKDFLLVIGSIFFLGEINANLD